MTAVAGKRDIPHMAALWHECFGEDYLQIASFFDSPQYKNVIPLVFRENGEIVSQLFLIDAVFKGESAVPSYYLFAACTHPDFRGRGIMARLISAAVETARINGREYICLLPADDGLYSYYEKLGFSYCCRACLEKTAPGEAAQRDYTHIPRFESSACSKLAFELRDVYGFSASMTEGYGIAVYEKRGRELYISDIEINSRTAEHIELLLKKSGCEYATVMLPAPDENSGTAYGMALSVSGKIPCKNIFLNFTLE